uniref:Uncharacterized protein n=1 Tax=Octopus bimaculoides TaxID=37653 RepID=A0A0L8I4J6_OCTBM
MLICVYVLYVKTQTHRNIQRILITNMHRHISKRHKHIPRQTHEYSPTESYTHTQHHTCAHTHIQRRPHTNIIYIEACKHPTTTSTSIQKRRYTHG